jgi:Cft2 family RNA processing exonuclease
VLAGYACQNTTAHELQGNKQTHKKEDGREIPVKSKLCSSCHSFEEFFIEIFPGKSYVVSFSAHADCQQTTEFIQELQPRNVILVHGMFAWMIRCCCKTRSEAFQVNAPKWKI